MGIPEELLLHLLLHGLLLDLGLEDLLDFVLVGVVLVDLPLVVRAELVGAVMEVVSGDDISLVVLAHAQFIDGQFFAVLVVEEDCQLDGLAVLYGRLFGFEVVEVEPAHVHAAEDGEVEQAQSARVVLEVAVDDFQHVKRLQVVLVEVDLVTYVEEYFRELALALLHRLVFQLFPRLILNYLGLDHLRDANNVCDFLAPLGLWLVSEVCDEVVDENFYLEALPPQLVVHEGKHSQEVSVGLARVLDLLLAAAQSTAG